MGELLLRIGELASRAGVTTRTVDFYTGIGLLQPAGRTDAGYRLYPSSAVDLIATIRHLETHGVCLDDIAHALHGKPVDVARLLARLEADLTALRLAAESAGPDAQTILAILGARAHALITTAIEIAAASPLT
jgi:MerR family transcriptional regulator, copper efflux regulator